MILSGTQPGQTPQMKYPSDGADAGLYFKYKTTENSQVQLRIYQILSLIEPIILNDENLVKSIAGGFVEILADILIFQSQNLMNIQKNVKELN